MAYERQATEKQIRYILRLAECDRLDQLRNMRTCPLACILSRDEENGRISKARANEQYGVWGGRTPDERRAVRRGMRRRESDIRDAGLDDGTIDAMMAEMRRRGLVL